MDIYLPDIKYSDPETAKKYSGVADYVSINREALVEMSSEYFAEVLDLREHLESSQVRKMGLRFFPSAQVPPPPQGVSRTMPARAAISMMVVPARA